MAQTDGININITINAPDIKEAMTDFKAGMAYFRGVSGAKPAPEPGTPKPEPVTLKPEPVTIKSEPVTPKPEPVTPKPEPVTSAPTAAPPQYKLADLAKAAAVLMDNGKQSQLLALLKQFDVRSMSQLEPAQYGAFATALRGLGAKL